MSNQSDQDSAAKIDGQAHVERLAKNPDLDAQREADLFKRVDSWGVDLCFGLHEDVRFLRRRLEETRVQLKRLEDAQIRQLKRRPSRLV